MSAVNPVLGVLGASRLTAGRTSGAGTRLEVGPQGETEAEKRAREEKIKEEFRLKVLQRDELTRIRQRPDPFAFRRSQLNTNVGTSSILNRPTLLGLGS